MSDVAMRPDTAAPLLSVRGLSFSYPGADSAVIDTVDLDLHAGEVLGVLGPNGAGKSTLLRAITGTVAGTRTGSVEVTGDRSIRSIGFASQDVALYPTLTLRENALQQARLLAGAALAPGLVDRVIEEFSLTHLAERRCHEFSGGQRRMSHLAVSFVHRPLVRFLDEPTSALDLATRDHLVSLVADWRQDGCAVLVTTHVPEDIEELCTDLVLLRTGSTVDLGSLSGFQARGRHELTVRSHSPMGERHEHSVELPGATVAEARSAMAAVPPEHVLTTIEFSAPGLRSVLRRDPALADYLGEHSPEPAGGPR